MSKRGKNILIFVVIMALVLVGIAAYMKFGGKDTSEENTDTFVPTVDEDDGSTGANSNLGMYIGNHLNYNEESLWSQRGGKEDTTSFDVFIISGSVLDDYTSGYNMDINDSECRKNIDYNIDVTSEIFADYCNVYSPYYRQANATVIIEDAFDETEALALAYADVQDAFNVYMDKYNNGRPVVIVGQSQGAIMGIQLLKSQGQQLEDKLVAAYLIGWRLTDDDLCKYVVPAKGETDTGVVISYNTESPDVTESVFVPAGVHTYSINPLNWATDSTPADRTANWGSKLYLNGNEAEYKNLCGAYIDPTRGTLKVTDLGQSFFNNFGYTLHAYDFMLFHENLRVNCDKRCQQYAMDHNMF